MAELDELRAYVDYFRDLGVHDFYRSSSAGADASLREWVRHALPVAPVANPSRGRSSAVQPEPSQSQLISPVAPPTRPGASTTSPAVVSLAASEAATSSLEIPIPKPVPFNDLAPMPAVRVAVDARPAALEQIRHTIGDCTRCPLAYAGRHTIVFGEGDPAARLLFVGEGPGADEDTSGRPFVGKAGQLLNNMIGAMGVTRESVYIANIVKCRPPNNRAPEPVEASTCSQFLLQQIDTVQPDVIVALGATAATYLLGVRQSLSSLRGRFHSCRGAKLAVTFHPAFLLRDPRQKAEAWKDLQMVMAELGLQPPRKPQA